MTRLEGWLHTPAGWQRRGRPTKFVDPEFQVGVDKPVRSNVGCRIPVGDLIPVAGSVTSTHPLTGQPLQHGDVIEGVDIAGVFRPNRYVILRDSRIRGGPTPYGQTLNLVDTRALTITQPVRLEHVTISPSHRSVDVYGFAYADVDAYRCLIEGVVDGASVHGGGSWPNTIHRIAKFEACLFTDSPWYADDPRQTDGSHNDFIQAHGSLSLLWVVGCTFGLDGEKADTTILLQQAHGLYDEIVITDNWFHGNPIKGAVLNMSETRGVGFTNLQFLRNRISAESNHSSPSPIVVKSNSRYPENFGWTGTVGSSPSTWVAGPSASVYMDGPNAGQPVRPKAG